ncbi:MAG: thioredoxin family protein [Planctomycetes bacterium]|nr:thioredoxin family protein [Planctomycetota bacterium]
MLPAAVGVWAVALAAAAQFAVPGLPSGSDDETITVTAQFTAPAAGQPSRLFVTAKIADGWHVFSVTQPAGGPVRTNITLAADQAAKLAGKFAPTTPPKKHPEPLFDNTTVEEHEKQVIWYAPLEWSAAPNEATTLNGEVLAQACSANSCLPPRKIKFTAKLGPGVPVDAKTASAEPQDNAKDQGQQSDSGYRQDESHLVLTGVVEPRGVAPGGPAVLKIRAVPVEGWYVYAYATSPDQPGPRPTLLHVASSGGLQVGAVTASVAPEVKQSSDAALPPANIHKGPVEWSVPITVPADAQAGALNVEGSIAYMTCSTDQCDRPTGATFRTQLEVGKPDAGPSKVTFANAKYITAVAALKERPATNGPAANASPTLNLDNIRAVEVVDTASMPLWKAMLFGFGGGFILNFMPCVLPVIGLKLLSFVQQGGQSRGRIVSLNLAYVAGLMCVFMILAVLASFFNLGWGQLFTYAGFTIGLTAVVFVMGLSFLGIWEVPVPGMVGTAKANDLAAQEGLPGAFFKGALTTLLATPCTAPLLAPGLAWAASQPPHLSFALFACAGLGMGSPYLVIGAVPSLARMLPKPGAWMQTFKEVMGFVLLATVVYLLTLLEWPLVVPTVMLLGGLWAGCWWGAKTPLYESAGKLVKAWTQAIVVAGAVGAVAFLWVAEHTAFRFDRDVDNRVAHHLAAAKRSDKVTPQVDPSRLPWEPFSIERLTALAGERRTVMVDFTADWCPTCKWLEKFVLNTPPMQEAVAERGIVTLLADWTHGDDDVTTMMDAFGGGKQIPVLAIFPEGRFDKPIILRGGYTQDKLLKTLADAAPKVDEKARTARR